MLRDSRRLHFKTKDQERYCEEIFELMTEPSSDDLTVRRMNQYLFHSVLESMGFVITEAQVKVRSIDDYIPFRVLTRARIGICIRVGLWLFRDRGLE